LGIILFSIGTVAHTSYMPLESKKVFLEVFKAFPNYTIIWKLDDEFNETIPFPHIHVVKWVPQRALLENPNLKVFITHGGYNSLLESCHAAVPLLMYPLFGDQYGNARRAERRGIGLMIDKENLLPDAIISQINELLTDEKFRKNSLYLSKVINDQIAPNPDLFVHWIQRFQRQKYWPKLKAVGMDWAAKNLYDFFGLFLVAITLTFLSLN